MKKTTQELDVTQILQEVMQESEVLQLFKDATIRIKALVSQVSKQALEIQKLEEENQRLEEENQRLKLAVDVYQRLNLNKSTPKKTIYVD